MLIIPLVVGGYIWLLRKRRKDSDDLGPLGIAHDQSDRKLGKRRHIPPAIFLIGLSLLIFSLSRPEMFTELPRIEGTVILAFDVSNSMAADDLEPTRMDVAKEAAKIFVENQPETILLGVVAFSNGGFVVQAPTNDQTAILETINRLSPQGATSLGQGIFSALNAIVGEAISIDPSIFEDGTPTIDIGHHPSSVILLLTDGENTSSPDPLEIAQLAAEAGIRIYPVGIGSTEGAILEIEGYQVVTQLNETALQEIADLTNGAYYHAVDEESLKDIYENVDLRLEIRGEKMEITSMIAGAALVFFLIGGTLSLFWFGRMPL